MPPMSTSISKYNYTIFVSRNRYPDEAVVVVESKKIGRKSGLALVRVHVTFLTISSALGQDTL